MVKDFSCRVDFVELRNLLRKDFEDGLIPPGISVMEVWVRREEYKKIELRTFACHFMRIIGSFYTLEGKKTNPYLYIYIYLCCF